MHVKETTIHTPCVQKQAPQAITITNTSSDNNSNCTKRAQTPLWNNNKKHNKQTNTYELKPNKLNNCKNTNKTHKTQNSNTNKKQTTNQPQQTKQSKQTSKTKQTNNTKKNKLTNKHTELTNTQTH